MDSLFNVSKSTIISNYINVSKFINEMRQDIRGSTLKLTSDLSDKDLLEIINDRPIKLLYEITKIIVKHIKEFIIIVNKQDYPDINDDITKILQIQDPITKISRDMINDMKVPWSILHFDIFLLYNYNLGTHKQTINDINNNSFFDYDDFVEFTNIFDNKFKFIYYDRWELSILSFFNKEDTWVLIHKNSKIEVLWEDAFVNTENKDGIIIPRIDNFLLTINIEFLTEELYFDAAYFWLTVIWV
jgi:hypothetical protein